MEFCADAGAERSVLSGIIQHGKTGYLEVSDLLTSESFTVPDNRAMYLVLAYIREKDLDCKIDYHTIMVAAKELKLDQDISDSKYIQRIISFNSELTNLRVHAKKIRKLQETRGLVGKLNDTAAELSKISGAESMSEIVTLAQQPIFDFINKITIDINNQITHIAEGLDAYVAEKEKGELSVVGVPTGFIVYDKAIGGLAEGVHIVSARPKIGKSTFGINVALYVSYKEKIPVLYLDTEMKKERGQWDRMLSRLSHVPFENIRDGSYAANPVWKMKVRKARDWLKQSKLEYVNISGRDFDEVLAMVRRWTMQSVGLNSQGKLNKCLLIYDYLKLTDNKHIKDMKEWEAIGHRMSHLHDMTTQYDFPALTFCQLNREFDISQSDRIRWFCTSICSLQKKEEDELANDGRDNGNRKLIVEDCRFGEGLQDGDYINFDLNGKISLLKELKTRNQLGRSRDEANLQPEPVSENF